MNIKCATFQQMWSSFNFGTSLGLTDGKYMIKIVFNIIKIKFEFEFVNGGRVSEVLVKKKKKNLLSKYIRKQNYG